MKQWLLLAIVLISSVELRSQTCLGDWLMSGGGPSFDYTASAVLDASENLYVAGNYDSSCTIGSAMLTAAPFRYGVFFSGFNAARSQIGSPKTIVTSKSSFFLPPLIARGGNYLYVLVRSYGDSLMVNGTFYKAPASSNLFILLQTDLSGNVLWQRYFPYKDLLQTTLGQGLTADNNGNVYIGGTFTDTMNVGGNTLGTPGSFSPSVFIAKINSSGNVVWARQSGSTASNYAYLRHMHLLAGGQVVAGGSYHGAITFGTHTAGSTNSSTSAGSPFLVSFDSSGTFAWLSAANSTTAVLSVPLAGAVDAAGNSYITGLVKDSLDFGGGNKIFGQNNMFIARYGPTGNITWAKAKAGHVSSAPEGGSAIAVNHAGNIVVTGGFSDSTYFGATRFNGAGGQDFFIATYDNAGNLLRASAYGSPGNDEVDALLVHANDSLLIGGYFAGATLTINGHSVNKTGTLGTDFFWYDQCKSSVGVATVSPAQNLRVYPNPANDEVTISFAKALNAAATVKAFDVSGRVISSVVCVAGSNVATLQTNGWPAGSYIIEIALADGVYRRMLVHH